VDLLSESELEELTALRALYESLGYATYAISALSLAGAADKELSSIFEGKVTLLSGNSGVGKSTLLNAILGSDIARTGAISSAHHKGMHTTTFSEMYPLPDANAWIIDTPGIKGFGLLDIQKEEVGHYFREIFEVSRACRYSNCIHMNEPGCAVNQAVMEGRIALSRYESYLSILDDTTEGKYR
jgi:ribosome biogenesis GTPase